MRVVLISVCGWVLALASLSASSRAYLSVDEYVQGASVIAVVRVEPERPRSLASNDGGEYRERSVEVVSALKGSPPKRVTIRYGYGRDDILFQQGEGLYLVFLKGNAGGLVPFDGWPSSKEICDGLVMGWKSHYERSEGEVPLEHVVKQIAEQVAMQK